jgi:hypothetical protein
MTPGNGAGPSGPAGGFGSGTGEGSGEGVGSEAGVGSDAGAGVGACMAALRAMSPCPPLRDEVTFSSFMHQLHQETRQSNRHVGWRARLSPY